MIRVPSPKMLFSISLIELLLRQYMKQAQLFKINFAGANQAASQLHLRPEESNNFKMKH